MCTYSRPGHVHISDATHELVRASYGAVDRGEDVLHSLEARPHVGLRIDKRLDGLRDLERFDVRSANTGARDALGLAADLVDLAREVNALGRPARRA